MKEVVFLNNNAKRWKSFEKILRGKEVHKPDEIADMFIKLTDDLAYAQTFYSNTETEHYLNALTVEAHHIIYKTKKERRGKFFAFWKYEFPLQMLYAKKYVKYSAIIFLISALIGAFSASMDTNFVRTILSDGYVDMTINNIEKGDPMAVYKGMDSFSMFLMIGFNNIKVAIYTVLISIFTSFGTAYLLFRNGIMLGSFQYFFYDYNVLYESVITIWIHGTIEIFSIIVAGAAGILMGNSLFFPGTYRRGKSFIIGSRKAMKILFGLFPFIILAAFLESYVTRHTEWKDIFQIAIIVASLVLIVWYFFIYPLQLNRKLKTDENLKKIYDSYFKE